MLNLCLSNCTQIISMISIFIKNLYFLGLFCSYDFLLLPLITSHMHTNTHTLMRSHLLTLILALYLTAECLMTLRGGTGESSRYNMLDRIQVFSMPQAC